MKKFDKHYIWFTCMTVVFLSAGEVTGMLLQQQRWMFACINLIPSVVLLVILCKRYFKSFDNSKGELAVAMRQIALLAWRDKRAREK